MLDLQNPFSRETLLKSIEKVSWEINKTCHGLSLDDFYGRPRHGWSSWDRLKHLIKVERSLANILRLPKFILVMKYGKSTRPSVRYEKLKNAYLKALSKKRAYGDRFSPGLKEIPPTEAEAEALQGKTIAKWHNVCQTFYGALDRWYEDDLDKYFIENPMLGTVTVRETIMSTLCHNLYHLHLILKRAQENESGRQKQE